MKNNKIFNVLLILLISLGIGCSSDNEVKLNPNDFVEPVFSGTLKDGLVITEETLNDVVGTFSWDPADFGVNTAILYSIYAATTEDFSDEKVFYSETGVKDNKLEVTQKALNEKANEFVNGETELTLYFRFAASIGEGSGAVELNAKDIAKVTFTNYYVPAVTDIFMTGSAYGWGGEWKQFIPVNDTEGAFWGIYYFNADDEVKFAPQADWKDDFGFVGTTISQESIDRAGLSNSGGNIKVGNAGWYLVYVSVLGKDKTVEFFEPNVYLIGDVSQGGWGVTEQGLFTVPTTADGEFVSPAFISAGQLRICVHFMEGIDWWRTEFIILEGKIAYRGNGGDQKRVEVEAGQKAYLKFSDNTGSIK